MQESATAKGSTILRRRKNKRKRNVRLVILLLLMVLTPLLSIVFGSANVSIPDIVGVTLDHLGFNVDKTWTPAIDAIVWQNRVPRIIAGLAVGAVLGVAGVVLQALVRNPLAEPYVLGVSSGASTGAALSIIVLGASNYMVTGSMAFAGALIATLMVMAVAGQGSTPLQLILAGLAAGFGFQAVTNLLIFSSGSPETSQAVMFWMLGSLARAQWPQLPLLVIVAVVFTAVMFFCGPILDALASGDRTAESVGVNASRMRVVMLIIVSASVAIAVAAAGGIGFVGLIVPHVIRSFIGYSHRFLVLGSALASSLFLVWMDAIARVAFAPAELPIGVITGLIGAPCLVVLIKRQRRAS
ncbi:FecCD family ABC transporter permease [Propionimicrobium lymphophilum]|uniref:FecCD family ABC transporter permease n=1 Tax=Propionimicrobium lymphophilum TaxID=33012 RepID=UPI0023F1100F|nr:iron ABC transporter permease [Propionimicrobium lymphophilum]